MSDEEKEIQALEDQFPLVSGQAFAAAREEALAAGLSVVSSTMRFTVAWVRSRVEPPAP